MIQNVLFQQSLGEIVHQASIRILSQILSILSLQLKWKEILDSVEEGQVKWVKVIDGFYQDFEKHVTYADAEMEKIVIKDEPSRRRL